MTSHAPDDDLFQLLLSWAASPDDMTARVAQVCPRIHYKLLKRLKAAVDAEKTRDARQALKIARVLEAAAHCFPPESKARFIAYWALGNAHFHCSHYPDALDCYQRAEQWYWAKRRWQKVAILLINQIAVYQDRASTSDLVRALELAAIAHPLCTGSSESALQRQAILAMNCSSVYHQMGRLIDALKSAEQAKERCLHLVQRGHPAWRITAARVTINIANILKDMNLYREARAALLEARASLLEAKQEQEVARAELDLGVLDYFQGMYEEALRWLEKARQMFETIPNWIDVAVVDMYRALIYQRLALDTEALALARMARKVFEAQQMARHSATLLVCEALIYARRQEYEKAGELLKRAMQTLAHQGAPERMRLLLLERAEVALARQALGTVQRLLHRLEKAPFDPTLWPAASARLHLLQARLALAMGQTPWHLVRHHCQRALRLAKQYRLPDLEAQARYVQGLAAEQRGRRSWARHFYLEAIRLVEVQRYRFLLDGFRLGFMEDKLPLYDGAIRVTHEMGEWAHLLLVLTLTQRLGMPPALLTPPAQLSERAQALAQRLRELQREWQWLASRLEALLRPLESNMRRGMEQHLQRLQAAIADTLHRFLAEIRGTGFPPPGALPSPMPEARAFQAALQARLGPTEALLHLYEVAGSFWALLVRATGVTPVKLAASSQIDRRYRSWLGQVSLFAQWRAGNDQIARADLSGLYQALVAPLAPHLEGVQHLFLVLPPAWHTLPVAALFDGQRFLAERFDVSHLSSAEALLATAVPVAIPTEQQQRALVVGYSSGGRLPATLEEAKRVAARLSPYSPTLLLEEQARAVPFLEASHQSSLLHLATHAHFDGNDALFSWIELADERLTLARLYAIALPQRPLVILSACETGRGVARGGGLVGMGRGFQAAGASGLVMSLWRVEDEATTRLMDDFYAALDLNRPLAPQAARALQSAQRPAIAQGASPFHWTAFLFMKG